jgi:hypothetical protein
MSRTRTLESRLTRLAELAGDEAAGVLALVSSAGAAQWDVPGRVAGEVDSAPIHGRGSHADPTAAIALDRDRLYLRAVLTRAEPLIEAALRDLRGVRRGLEMAMAAYGEGPPPT